MTVFISYHNVSGKSKKIFCRQKPKILVNVQKNLHFVKNSGENILQVMC